METGYENILLVRLLLEIKAPHLRKSSVCRLSGILCPVIRLFYLVWFLQFMSAALARLITGIRQQIDEFIGFGLGFNVDHFNE